MMVMFTYHLLLALSNASTLFPVSECEPADSHHGEDRSALLVAAMKAHTLWNVLSVTLEEELEMECAWSAELESVYLTFRG